MDLAMEKRKRETGSGDEGREDKEACVKGGAHAEPEPGCDLFDLFV